MQVGTRTFTDEHNLGAVPLSVILAKSSNVGMARLALALITREAQRIAAGEPQEVRVTWPS